ncbi:MAG TPA: UDP-glucose/GDP-mannose dehydrogenase family protein [Terriglobia bacterium]|nr:UDP-glucose/GDP-mannose dehydrogenase family protein [Terriglobia bacterium]
MEARAKSISVFGLGYVGSVTAACLAHLGHRVIGVDVNSTKVEMTAAGRCSIIEARMDELMTEAHQSGRLQATGDAAAAIRDSEISFVCVGTPSQRNGKLDLSHVEHVCGEIGEGLRGKISPHLVAIRSTVLPGTTGSVVIPRIEAASGRRAGSGFQVCYNPEFMREGSAVEDFFHPPYTILGTSDPAQLAPMREIYQWASSGILETSLAVAEMVKYASNAFHALKVGFANELGTLSKHLGVDTHAVTEIFTSDNRLNISPAYLRPGFAFGGSCLPKDLRALSYRARELDLRLPLLDAIMASNHEHIERAVEAVLRTKKKNIGLLGLSFKAGTDDLRESPQVQLTKRLLGEGCQIRIWDQNVSLGQLTGSNRQFIQEVIPHIGSLLTSSLQEAVENSEVIIIGTATVSHEALRTFLRPGQTVIDLVNLDKSLRPEGPSEYEGICW